MRGPLGFLFVNDFLTPQGSVDAPKVIHESIPRKPPMHEKCRFLGLFRPFEAVIHRLQRARSVSRPSLIPTFTTAVNTWQCDENDHLNVQFYTEFGHEASAHLLAELGLGPRAQRAAALDVRAASDHIRYLREFREVDPVEVLSAPVEVGDTSPARLSRDSQSVRRHRRGDDAPAHRLRPAMARRIPRARRGRDRGTAGQRQAAQRRQARPARSRARRCRAPRPDRQSAAASSLPPNATSAASSCRTISSAATPTARRCCGTISASTAPPCRTARKARWSSRC